MSAHLATRLKRAVAGVDFWSDLLKLQSWLHGYMATWLHGFFGKLFT